VVFIIGDFAAAFEMERHMNIKTGILAAATALTLALPAAALAQPYYGPAPAYGYAPGYARYDDWRRVEREREWRRAEAFRRVQWERDHYGYRGYYR
jgi:hypothetical protein